MPQEVAMRQSEQIPTVTVDIGAWPCSECGQLLSPLEDDIHWSVESEPLCVDCAPPVDEE